MYKRKRNAMLPSHDLATPMVSPHHKLLMLLKQCGFKETESAVYLAAFACGPAAATTIARHAKLPRSTTYHALKNLISKELITETTKQHEARYTAIAPRRILEIIKTKQAQFSYRIDQLNTALHLFDHIKNNYQTITTKIRDGTEAIRSYLEGLTARNEILIQIHYLSPEPITIIVAHGATTFVMHRNQQAITVECDRIAYLMASVLGKPPPDTPPVVSPPTPSIGIPSAPPSEPSPPSKLKRSKSSLGDGA